MIDSEAYTLVTTTSHHQVWDDYVDVNSGKGYNLNTYLQAALRRQYPELCLTVTLANNVNLLAFAFAGHATATLDIVDESVLRTRYFLAPASLGEARSFAKYLYKWGDEYFIVYIVSIAGAQVQYVLKEPLEGETVMSGNSRTDELVKTIGIWQIPPPAGDKFVYVYDRYWFRSRELYEQIKEASWKDVILNEEKKKQITDLMHKFFDSKEIYKNLGVSWKRGVIFHGPAGNGKTISIKALMNSLFKSDGLTIPSLYVKSAASTYDIRNIFEQARYMSPCLLIFEDIDTVVTQSTRSYFFNEVDGLENNDGIFMVASTNHLEQLDPGLSSRPSRFDRKYLFPLPSEEERVLYCDFWRERLKGKQVKIDFPKKLCPAVALITDGFSFAYMQEAFVASLLAIAQRRSENLDEGREKKEEKVKDGGDGNDEDDDGDKDLDECELWREIKLVVKALRDDMDNTQAPAPATTRDTLSIALEQERDAQRPAAGSGPTAMHQSTTLPLRPAEDLAMRKHENPRLQGMVGDVDAQNVPIITDEGFFTDSRVGGAGDSQLL
ncbi:hypothetical protein N7G274_008274 [Stereocaulon virgatum]|uniref:AAA+ ATPase domain-containing protein n=1 Tax=Stereocaulon virgatum TaxID=373712 RepID=A0ABR4A0C3_9LECA